MPIYLLICLILLTGCLYFGNNYNYKTAQSPPVQEIGKWLGAPLPNTYANLQYDIIADTPDPQARIAVNVSKEYFQMIIKKQNLVKYDDFKNKLPDDLKPREWKNGNHPKDFINKPLSTTTIWITKDYFYPKYYWYQNSTLYMVYSSK